MFTQLLSSTVSVRAKEKGDSAGTGGNSREQNAHSSLQKSEPIAFRNFVEEKGHAMAVCWEQRTHRNYRNSQLGIRWYRYIWLRMRHIRPYFFAIGLFRFFASLSLIFTPIFFPFFFPFLFLLSFFPNVHFFLPSFLPVFH